MSSSPLKRKRAGSEELCPRQLNISAPTVANNVCKESEELMEFLSRVMDSFKCSAHDVAHCKRVASLAVSIATATELAPSDSPSPVVNKRVVYLSGLLHDVLDSKLASQEESTQKSTEDQIVELLRDKERLDGEEIKQVLRIVKNIGYKNIIAPEFDPSSFPLEYHCVQDADLLDAIGGIGLARVFSYSGGRNRPIFGIRENCALDSTLSKTQYIASSGSSIEHFFDKLLRIRHLLHTAEGTRLGYQRHYRMVGFLRDVDQELFEAGAPDAGKITDLLKQDRIVSTNS